MRSTRRLSPHHRAVIEQRAHGMRHAPTRAEAMLWELLRGRALGVQFRRQVRIGCFIADFAAPEVRLVVEVDGGWHRGREGLDARRDRRLERAGYHVWRIRAGFVLVLEEPEVCTDCWRGAARRSVATTQGPFLRWGCVTVVALAGLTAMSTTDSFHP